MKKNMPKDEEQQRQSPDILHEDNILKNPFEQFKIWFEDAGKSGIEEYNAVTLATATKNGHPSARIVLLKGVEENEFIFYTNYNSKKGKNLQENPYASLVFFWQPLHRQIRIEGKVKKISSARSDRYFHSRPRGSQLGAVISPQSDVIENREFLDQQLTRLNDEFSDAIIPRPKHWGGYALDPSLIEFWQGRRNRLHDRIVYLHVGKNWKIERLAP
jgi:pyridoxamine 5'-phosphate oxidase